MWGPLLWPCFTVSIACTAWCVVQVYPVVMNLGVSGEVEANGPADPAAGLTLKGQVSLDGGDINLVATQMRLDREHVNRILFSSEQGVFVVQLLACGGRPKAPRGIYLWHLPLILLLNDVNSKKEGRFHSSPLFLPCPATTCIAAQHPLSYATCEAAVGVGGLTSFWCCCVS